MTKARIRVLAAVTAVATLAPLVSTSGSASADSSGITNSDKRVLAMVGSDTTYFVMEAIATAYNSSKANTESAGADRAVNVPPILTVPAAIETAEAGASYVATKGYLKAARYGWPAGTYVPGDNDCKKARLYGGEGAVDTNGNTVVGSGETYYTTVNNVDLNTDSDFDDVNEKIELGAIPPNGSGGGRTFAIDTTNNPVGCVDIVRSSSAPSAGTQRDTFDTWAFALDAIGWLYHKSNTHKVKALTKSTLNKVYTCSGTSPYAPVFGTWGDLSGDAADTTPIKAYRIQEGSGTGSDVATTLLNLAGNANSNYTNCTSAAVFPFITVQEHDCTGVADADLPHAICFYGYSRWRLQQVGIEVDKRKGFLFGRFAASDSDTPKLPTPATINESASRYGATRLVYNLVYKGVVSGSPAVVTTPNPSFDDSISLVGVTTGGVKGYICSGAASRLIRLYGLVPLPSGTTDAAVSSYGNSYCRHNKYSL